MATAAALAALRTPTLDEEHALCTRAAALCMRLLLVLVECGASGAVPLLLSMARGRQHERPPDGVALSADAQAVADAADAEVVERWRRCATAVLHHGHA